MATETYLGDPGRTVREWIEGNSIGTTVVNYSDGTSWEGRVAGSFGDAMIAAGQWQDEAWVKEPVSVVLGEGVTVLEEFQFNGCEQLVSVTAPSTLSRLLAEAFNGCTGLTSLVFPNTDSGAFYGDSVFRNCTGLRSVTVNGAALVETDPETPVFTGCESLTAVTVLGATVDQVQSGSGWPYGIGPGYDSNVTVTCSDGSFTIARS